MDASPVLLEPIMHVDVLVPNEYMGDIMGDMNKRRGRIMGMNQVNGMQQLEAEAPLAEMFKYATDLRSMTQARGSFSMKFERYEEVPQAEAQKIRNETDKQVSILKANAEKDAAKIEAEGEAKYMQILSNAYNDEGKAEFYNYLRGLDSLEALAGKNKTLILDKDSEYARILYGE